MARADWLAALTPHPAFPGHPSGRCLGASVAQAGENPIGSASPGAGETESNLTGAARTGSGAVLDQRMAKPSHWAAVAQAVGKGSDAAFLLFGLVRFTSETPAVSGQDLSARWMSCCFPLHVFP